jgi:hypothetical protein
MAQFRAKVAYGLSDALITEAPFPVQALRPPTAADIGYLVGTLWIDKVGQGAYILVGIVANQAVWNLLGASGAPGVFTTLTSSGNTTLATAGVTVNSFGTTNGATSVTILAGTGGLVLDGAGATDISIGGSITTGNISIGAPEMTTGTIDIGGGAMTGSISIGSATGAQSIFIGGAGDNTITIGDLQGGGSISLGGSMTSGSINIGGTGAMVGGISVGAGTGAQSIVVGGTGDNVIQVGDLQAGGSVSIGEAMVAGSINIGGAAQTGAIFLGSGTATQTISIGAAGGSPKVILIGTGATNNAVTVGSLDTTAGTVIQAGTQGIFLNAPFVELPGPIYMYTGAGAPGAGLALHAGDTYINTTPTGATDRMFIATGVGTWTNVTCAA